MSDAARAIGEVRESYDDEILMLETSRDNGDRIADAFQKERDQAREAIEEALHACGLDRYTPIEDVAKVIGELVRGLKAAKAELLHRVEHLKREGARQCQ